MCIYYFNRLRIWWRRRRTQKQNNIENERARGEQEQERIRIEMERTQIDELEKRLERVYFKLVEVNAIHTSEIQTIELNKQIK